MFTSPCNQYRKYLLKSDKLQAIDKKLKFLQDMYNNMGIRFAANESDIHSVDIWNAEYGENDIVNVDILNGKCVELWNDMIEAPENLYNRYTSDIFTEIQSEACLNSSDWIDSNPKTRGYTQGEYYPAVAYFESKTLMGFEYLYFEFIPDTLAFYERHGRFQNAPTLYDDGESFHPLFAHSSMAMLMNGFGDVLPKPIQNIYILCKGFKEFNRDGIVPLLQGNELIWFIDTDHINNIKAFVESVMKCSSFIDACSAPCNGQPLKRIVVWLLLKGHFEAFCWDQKYAHDESVVQNVLYIFSTVREQYFRLDTKVHTTIIQEFKTAMINAGIITDSNTLTISDLECADVLRESTLTFVDLYCVLFTGFSSLILTTVFDIVNWSGEGITPLFWDFCRAKYAEFEFGLIETLQDLVIERRNPVWICSALSETNVDINKIHLTTISEGVNKRIEFNWNSGWIIK